MFSVTRTVLIVEPEPDQQWKLARMFTVGGFRVIGTSSIPAAQALLHAYPVDMILLSPDACQSGPGEAARSLLACAPQARMLVMEAGNSETEAPRQRITAAGAVLEFVRRPARAADVSALS